MTKEHTHTRARKEKISDDKNERKEKKKVNRSFLTQRERRKIFE